MATSIKDIYNEIILEKETMSSLTDLGHTGDNADTLLTDLNSGSKVSIWRLWAYVMAVVIFFHEKLWDLFKAEVETKLRAIPGTNSWMTEECKKFQYGDQLTFNSEGTYGYDVIDTDKQIIKRAAVVSNLGNAVVKVATSDTEDGPLRALDSAEKLAFDGYLNLIQYAGTTVNAVTGESDKMKITLDIYYNALIPLDTVSEQVEAAINNYLANLEFDGTFKIMKMVDAIQEIEGVKDISVIKVEARQDSIEDFSPVSRIYNPASGYIEIDSGENNGLADTITYKVE